MEESKGALLGRDMGLGRVGGVGRSIFGLEVNRDEITCADPWGVGRASGSPYAVEECSAALRVFF